MSSKMVEGFSELVETLKATIPEAKNDLESFLQVTADLLKEAPKGSSNFQDTLRAAEAIPRQIRAKYIIKGGAEINKQAEVVARMFGALFGLR